MMIGQMKKRGRKRKGEVVNQKNKKVLRIMLKQPK